MSLKVSIRFKSLWIHLRRVTVSEECLKLVLTMSRKNRRFRWFQTRRHSAEELRLSNTGPTATSAGWHSTFSCLRMRSTSNGPSHTPCSTTAADSHRLRTMVPGNQDSPSTRPSTRSASFSQILHRETWPVATSLLAPPRISGRPVTELASIAMLRKPHGQNTGTCTHTLLKSFPNWSSNISMSLQLSRSLATRWEAMALWWSQLATQTFTNQSLPSHLSAANHCLLPVSVSTQWRLTSLMSKKRNYTIAPTLSKTQPNCL